MPAYISAGARNVDGTGFKSKAALKRALAAGEPVKFYTTGQFPNPEFEVRASELSNRPRAADERWSIVGPDPYTSRKWYATVTVNNLGNLKVS